ncbi:hypothetical protein BDZ85DRAFT_89551 [Elsinoe ampelina]|uniref:C2H2-type domain-containing protein n=1 Tax=Elsinoe ampelina TaxID=302913 RepID=A0A6A6GHG4_9PEZI|nr:hypothetical protein BDZ85DRAFT_89551 [Elsinoe ampelina]
MTSYYSQHPMSSGEDFPLYSYSDNYNASYMPTTSYDSYAPHTAVDKSGLTSQSPSYSPAMSASNSFDVPPHFNGTSDSGASGPSTISSAIPSPSLSGQNPQEWMPHQGGLNIVHDDFHGESQWADTDGYSDKISGCVGESTSLSSTSFPITTSFSSFSIPTGTSYPPPQHRHDSIQHEAAYSQHFKSPTTPASAVRSPHPPVSPAIARVTGQRRASVPSSRVAAHRMSSPLAHEQMSPEEPRTPQIQRVAAHQQATHQSPFSYHSSGAFVPPLESSYPSLIEPYSTAPYAQAPYAGSVGQSPAQMFVNPPSPAMSQQSYHMAGPIRTDSRASQWQPYTRGHSVMSAHSHVSRRSSGSCDSDENKVICPIASCGRPIRDLKAHMLTHQSERPEKCPIPSCPYHLKGFARKYDKNRHTLTHYKGTMVCDFCPGSGSSAEKSFNRTDVFKRHLQSVHNVEQTTPNSRRRKPAAKKGREIPGTCRTCGVTFPSAQDLHDHIDDCVLRVVQQTEPSEAINEKLLTSVADDEDVKASLSRHNLPTSLEGPTSFSGDDDDADDDSTLRGSASC